MLEDLEVSGAGTSRLRPLLIIFFTQVPKMQTNAKNANRLCPLPYMYEHDHDDEEVLTMWESHISFSMSAVTKKGEHNFIGQYYIFCVLLNQDPRQGTGLQRHRLDLQ